MLWSSVKTGARFCISEGRDSCSNAGWGLTWGEQLCWKGTMTADKQGTEPAVRPGSKKGQKHPRLFDQEHIQRWSKLIPLYPAFVKLHLEHYVQFWTLEQINCSGFSGVSPRWSGAGTFTLWGCVEVPGSAWGQRYAGGSDCSSLAPMGRSPRRWSQALQSLVEFRSWNKRGSDFMRKILFCMKIVSHWTRFPRNVFQAPSFELLKILLDKVQSNLIWSNSWLYLEEEIGLQTFWDPFQLELSYGPVVLNSLLN